MSKRAALYLRVSTSSQETANQRQALEQAAAQRGWEIVAVYEDAGISGAKGRDKRPGLDAMLRDAVRGMFSVLMAWSVDRIGRSMSDLVASLQELHGSRVDLFLHQQAIDTTTPAGKALFQMCGVFAEFERSMIQQRVNAGLARARAETPEQRRERGKKAFGRPRVDRKIEATIRTRLAAGGSVTGIVRALGVGVSTVQRVKAEMVGKVS